MRQHVELIAAVGPHWELGHKGGMPWGRIKGDLAHFASVTRGKSVVMGRKTWESLPEQHRPLKGRTNIVLTRTLSGLKIDLPHVHVVTSGGGWSAMEWARSTAATGREQLIIIGGGEVYRAALEADVVDVIHLSVIHPCDLYHWSLEDGDWDTRAYHRDGIPLFDHDVKLPALSDGGWAVAARTFHRGEDGAPHGWTQLRLVRDPGAAALDGAGDAVPPQWLKRMEDRR